MKLRYFRGGTLWYVALALLAGAALLVRFRWLHESLWIDELHTAWVVTGDWTELAGRCWDGNQLPLYFALVKLTTTAVGISEVGLRSISLASGVILVVVVACLVRHWTQSAALGLFAGALAAWDRHLVFYSLEARPYSVVQLLTAVHMFLWGAVLEQSRWRHRMAWIGVNGALFWLHPTAVLTLLAAPPVLAVARLRWGAAVAYSWRRLVVDLALSMATIPLALPYLAHVAGRRLNWEAIVPRPDWLDLVTLYPLFTYAVVPAMAAFAMRAIRPAIRSVPADRTRQGLLIAIAITVVPLAAAWILSATDVMRIFLRRYVAGASVSLICLPAIIAAWIPAGGRRWVLLGLLSPLLLISGPRSGRRTDEDWRGLVTAMRTPVAQRPMPVLLQAGLIEQRELQAVEETTGNAEAQLRDYLLFPLRSAYRLDLEDRLLFPVAADAQSPPMAAQHLARQYGGMWLIVRGTPSSAGRSAQRLGRALADDGLVPVSQRSFGRRLHLIQFASASSGRSTAGRH